MNKKIRKIDLGFLFFLISILFLNYLGLENMLLFHFIAEILTIIIGNCIFATIWTIREKIDNSFYYIFAIGLLFTAIFDLLHVLNFEGMFSLHEYSLNYSLYFWVAARFLLGLTFFLATINVKNKININIVLILYTFTTAFLVYIISLRILPPLFNANGNISSLRISLEIFVNIMYLISLIFLNLNRKSFAARTLRTLSFAILFTICSEIVITLNTSDTHLVSIIGLDLKIIAYILFFRIILATGITQPQEIFYYSLQENQKQLQDLINNLNDGICIIDLNDKFELSNPAAEKIFGVKAGKLTNYHITDFISQNSLDIYQKQKKMIENKRNFSGILEIMNYQKEIRSLFITASPQIINGELIGILTIIHDYTIRQKEVDKLEEAKRYYQTLFMDAPIRIWENDYSRVVAEIQKLKEQGITDFQNYFETNEEKVKEFAQLIHINSYNKLAGKVYNQRENSKTISSPSEIFWEGSYPQFVNDLIAISKGETTRKFDMTTRTTSGEIRFSIINWSVVPGFEEDYSRVIVFVEDITERKALEKQMESLARFPEENPNPVMRISKIGKVVYSNQGSRNILKNWNCEESMLVPDKVNKIVQSCLKNNKPEILEVKIGSNIISLHFAPNPDLSYVNIYGRDVTNLKNAEAKLLDYSRDLEKVIEEKTEELLLAHEKLIKQEKLATMGQLAGSVGHELRNPLAVINNAIYILKANSEGKNKTTQPYLEIIDHEVASANKIITDLLTFARIKPANLNLSNPKSLINNVLKKFMYPDNIIVKNLLDTDLGQIYVDDKQIEQVITNLVINAYQAMPAGGELTISGSKIGKKIELDFSDTGVGIPPENLEKIFDPLFTTKLKGIGLGLTVSKILTEINGGTIEVKSTSENGTTFMLAFPLENNENNHDA